MPPRPLRILITAGPTRELMDPVRYLTNASSGAMGFAIAEACLRKRVRVTVVCGPTSHVPPKKIQWVPVVTAREMEAAVQKRIAQTDVFIATAAVCDFRFEQQAHQKIKKGQQKRWNVTLVKNPDILKQAGEWKCRHPQSNLMLVGFALETSKIESAMKKKFKEKNLDLIIGNTPASFAGPHIKPIWLERGGSIIRFPLMSKRKLGAKISSWIHRCHGQ